MSRIRVFIGYGYNARDVWVETYVVPLVKAFGLEVAHGKAVFGGALAPEVLKEIQSSDAMIGFTTRRDAFPDKPSQFSTHPWVVHELTAALAQRPPLPAVEVREEGVVPPGGLIDALNAQRIDYQEVNRAECLVAIAQALERFALAAAVTTVRLAPEATVDEFEPLLGHPTFACLCQVLQRGRDELPPVPTPVLPIKGGLFVKIRGLGRDDLIRVTVSAQGRVWRSDYESVDTVDIQMRGQQ